MSISNAILDDLKAKLDTLQGLSQDEKDRILKSLKTPTHLYPKQIVPMDKKLLLRSPDHSSVKYKDIVNSIKKPRKNSTGETTIDHGLILPIAVREYGSRPGMYVLVDGNHRFEAWIDAFGESKPIPCIVLDLDDEAAMIAQVEANIHKKDQQRSEVGKHMRRLLAFHDNWTTTDLSNTFNISVASVNDFLSLTNLPDDIQARVDKTSKDPAFLPVTVGYALAKFTPPPKATPEQIAENDDTRRKWMARYDELANESQGLNRFYGEAAKAQEIMRANRRKPKGTSFEPGDVVLIPTVRKKSLLEVEFERTKEAVNSFDDDTKKSAKEFTEEYPNETKYLKAATWRECLEYVLQVDDATRIVREAEEAKRAEAKKEASNNKKAGEKTESVARVTSFSNLFK
jgi:ParB/RepB/Spo0J family partition protein